MARMIIPVISLLLCMLSLSHAGSVNNFYTWEDLNGDGIQQPNEPPLTGISLTLVAQGSTSFGTTTINGGQSGVYSFIGVPNDSCASLTVSLPVGGAYQFTQQQVVGGTSPTDSDADSTGKVTQPGLAAGCVNTTSNPTNILAAGLVRPITVKVFVWEDQDGDGIQDSGEPGIAGIVVTLSNGATTTQAISPLNGIVIFSNVLPRPTPYTITLSNLGTYRVTTQDISGNTQDSIDNDFNSTGNALITVVSGSDLLFIGAGLYNNPQIIVSVFDDNNANGIRDGEDVALTTPLTTVLQRAGTIITPSQTTVNGIATYAFPTNSFLPSRSFSMYVPLATGYQYSPRDEGLDDTVDSDVSDTTGLLSPFTVLSGQSFTVGVGEWKPATIGPIKVWKDINGNGIFDNSEPPIVGASVYLTYVGQLTRLYSGTSDASGLVTLFNVRPGDYQLHIGLLSPSYVYTLQNAAGSDISNDSDVDPGDGTVIINARSRNTVPATETIGNVLPNLGAGEYIPAIVLVNVFEDLNHNGLEDAEDPGIPNALVRIDATDNSYTASVLADLAGVATFTGLRPNSYIITVSSGGLTFTLQNVATNAAQGEIDSDANSAGQIFLGAVGGIPIVQSGAYITDIGAGLYLPASITSFIWNDLNANGIQDAGEPGLGAVACSLYRSDTNVLIQSTQSNGNGDCIFTQIGQDEYDLVVFKPSGFVFTEQNVGNDRTVDSDVNPSTGIATFSTIKGQVTSNIDAGLYVPSQIQGFFVWNDLNGNGIQDANEPGLTNVEIDLFASNCIGPAVGSDFCPPVLNVTTNSAGRGNFTNITPGDYCARVILPSTAYFFTRQNQGTNDALDSDVDSSTGVVCFPLTSTQVVANLAAGLYQVGIIQDFYVWYDLNLNGIQDQGEMGLYNFEVDVLNAGTNVIVATGLTNIVGRITFTLSVGGNFDIRVHLPNNWVFTQQHVGSDGSIDSDIDPSTGLIHVTLPLGTIVTNLAAGAFIDGKLVKDIAIQGNNNNEPPFPPTLSFVLPTFLVPSVPTIQNASPPPPPDAAFALSANLYLIMFMGLLFLAWFSRAN